MCPGDMDVTTCFQQYKGAYIPRTVKVTQPKFKLDMYFVILKSMCISVITFGWCKLKWENETTNLERAQVFVKNGKSDATQTTENRTTNITNITNSQGKHGTHDAE